MRPAVARADPSLSEQGRMPLKVGQWLDLIDLVYCQFERHSAPWE